MDMSVKRKGIALAVTMLILGVMTVISIAFFQAYHSHFSITRSSRASEVAASGCEAIYDYVSYRLEHDRNWGETDFADVDKEKDPDSAYLELESLSGTHDFEGKIPDTGATFKGTIYNNLGGVLPEGGLIPPAQTARCEIECKSGDATRRVEFLVRVAPLFDSSALSRADLKVDAESLTLRSRDTNRNMLRSEQDIYVPNMLSEEGRTKFYQADSDTADNNGLLWAKGDIYSFDDLGALGTPEKIDEGEEFAKAQETSNGKIAPGATSHFSVFEMDKELLKVPETHTEIPLVNPISGISGFEQGRSMKGRFTFTRRPANVSFNATYDITNDNEQQTLSFTTPSPIMVDVLEYYANPDDSTPTAVFRAKERTEDLLDVPPATIIEDTEWGEWSADPGYLNAGSIQTTGVDVIGYDVPVTVLDNNKLIFGQETAANFTFDLRNQEVTATHDAQITVDGPFHVTSQDFDSSDPVPPPKLLLGYESSGSIDGGVSKAVVRAQGTIDIKNGVTEGLGALISENGDVKIQPKNTNTVTVDSSLAGSGLLVFAGGDVELTNPEDPTETEEWIFKGLVYARGGIRMNGNGAANATFEGSIVARQESAPVGDGPNGIEFLECGDIEFIYSSKMLDAYVSQLEGERIKVETIYWRD